MAKVLEPINPGEILREDFRKPMWASINRLARDIAVPPGGISGIVNGKRRITANTALRLARDKTKPADHAAPLINEGQHL